MAKPEKPWVGRAVNIERVISYLEGWAFGGWLKFSTIGYGGALNIALKGGWVEVEGFHRVPGLDEFAAELNAVMEPVIEAYAKRLRQELANECAHIATRALSKES